MADHELPALVPSPPEWLAAVLADFDAFLVDHASCEKKASGMALSIASHYPDRPALLAAMTELAVEELGHYREVIRLLLRRGVTPGPDRKDSYVRALNAAIRRGPEWYLLDRLLVAALVERRGHERFGLVARALPPGPEQRFFTAIEASEWRHWRLFLDLAQDFYPAAEIGSRFRELADQEARVMQHLPLRPALH